MTALSTTASMTRPGFSASFRSGRTRGIAAQVLLGLMIGLSLLSAIHNVAGFDLIRDAQSGTLSISEADSYDATAQSYAQAYLVLYIATAIAFLMWLSRSIDNVPHLTGEFPDVTPRWSIGWWFVPFANLFKPYQVVRDLFVRIAADGQRSWVILAWWLVWIGGGVLGTFIFRMAEPADLDDLNTWFTLNLLSDLSTVVPAALAIIIVRRIQRSADALALANGQGRQVSEAAAQPLPPCPRCGTPRVAGQQFCGTCRLDLWGDYDRASAGERSTDGKPNT